MKEIVPYLPIIIPLQINNFLTTLQGLESAKEAGDNYPERQSMLMDGVFTLIGSFLGNPFLLPFISAIPAGRKSARAWATPSRSPLPICWSASAAWTEIIMAVVPYEAVLVLLIFVGFSVSGTTLQNTKPKYIPVILISMIPIIFQYIRD